MSGLDVPTEGGPVEAVEITVDTYNNMDINETLLLMIIILNYFVYIIIVMCVHAELQKCTSF